MTKCANCGREFEGNGRVCFECSDELQIITAPKVTGWTNADDENLKSALELVGIIDPNEQWTVAMRISGTNRVVIDWIMGDIKRAKERIAEYVQISLDQFADERKLV